MYRRVIGRQDLAVDRTRVGTSGLGKALRPLAGGTMGPRSGLVTSSGFSTWRDGDNHLPKPNRESIKITVHTNFSVTLKFEAQLSFFSRCKLKENVLYI